jgi:hypothetical protein
MNRFVKIPESALISRTIRFLALGLIIVLLGAAINKFFGFVNTGVIITFVGAFFWGLGLLIGIFAIIKSWFS